MVDKKVTLITGTSKGIGKELVHYYVNKGHIVVGCSRSGIDWQLDGYTHHLADVSNEKQVLEIFKQIKKDFGRLDHLINNAGIASMNHSLLTSVKTVEDIFKTNFIGTFLFCREAAKLMKKHNYGRIVNFSTVSVPIKLDGEAIYAASKAAIVSLTQILAKELVDFGITVNAVGPNPIHTDLIAGVPTKKLEKLIEMQVIKRYGTVQDIENIIDFFLKKESDFITSQVIYLGGL